MHFLIVGAIASLAGLFAGSQIDDAVEKKFEPAGGKLQSPFGSLTSGVMLVGGGIIAFHLAKRFKLIK